MSNVKDELGYKGSKLLIQIAINNSNKKEELDNAIGHGNINWLSPLSKENFKEYQLNEVKGLFNHEIDYTNFWPENGPKWDAIGKAEDGTIILLEAKAHIEEIDQNKKDHMNAKSDESKALITKSIYEAFECENEKLINNYYQLANRFTYLNKLMKEGEKVLLVFVYFVNDVTYIPTTKDEYETYLSNGFLKDINLPNKFEEDKNYKVIYFDMWK